MKPHMMKGMIHPFEVTAQAGAADHFSGATDTLTVTEYAFTQTPTLTPGHHTILVAMRALRTMRWCWSSCPRE
jgi:hypothetical protein